jgi:ribosomal protein S12 methylthiotransferase accessory factor
MDMTITLGEGKHVTAHVDGFHIETDQPVAGGGDGSAPDPFTLFLASLGTCAGFFVGEFCRARGIPTAGIQLVQHNHKDPETKKLARVELALQLPPDFPAEYRDAIGRAALACKVKKTLAAPPEVAVSVA